MENSATTKFSVEVMRRIFLKCGGNVDCVGPAGVADFGLATMESVVIACTSMDLSTGLRFVALTDTRIVLIDESGTYRFVALSIIRHVQPKEFSQDTKAALRGLILETRDGEQVEITMPDVKGLAVGLWNTFLWVSQINSRIEHRV